MTDFSPQSANNYSETQTGEPLPPNDQPSLLEKPETQLVGSGSITRLIAELEGDESNVPWSWWDLGHVMAISLAGLIVLMGILRFCRLNNLPLSGDGHLTSGLGIVITVAAYGLAVFSIYWCTVRRYHVPWSSLAVRSVSSKQLLEPIQLFPVLLCGLAAANLLTKIIIGGDFDNPQIKSLNGGLAMTPANVIVILFLASIVAPIGEELLFRGMLYPLLRRHGVKIAIPVNALLFAAMHMIPILLPGLFVSGLLLAWLRERSNSIFPSILLHMMQNTAATLMIYALSTQGIK